MGTSMMFAFRDVARLDFGKLSPYIRRMSARLELGIDKKLSWSFLQRETSSELVRIHSEAFSASNIYGAPAREYGPTIANSALFMLTLRRRVEETSALMKGIAVPMTPVLSAIMGLIMGIITQFVSVFKTFQSQGLTFIFGFSSADSLPVLQSYIYIMILILIIVNAFILQEVDGEQDFDFTYYIGMFTIASWLIYFISSTAVSGYLQGIGLANLGNIATPGS
jgi:archaellum biogenesis protein FlaJ (TadC family)